MKNKKAIYFLLPLVLIIWGLIIYRIVSGSASDNYVQSAAVNIPLKLNQEKVDTFSIYADYSDPFLDYIWEFDDSGSDEEAVVEEIVPVIEKPPIIINWPKISFGGIVKNQKSNKQVIIINIGEVGHLMKAGDVVSGVTLKKVFNDSIQVSFEKENKTIVK